MKFDNDAYMTRGFSETIPPELQITLFNILKSKKSSENELDYLQVVKLTKKQIGESLFQEIVWQQEQPPTSDKMLLPCKEAVTCKVFIIDDETHHTYLLAEEY